MARIRAIKPDFFDDEDLARVAPDPDTARCARLLFAGLWCQADKRGRLEDRPARLRARLFPYDQDIDEARVDALLGLLAAAGFILRYIVDGQRCLWVRSFERHQHVNAREPESRLPPPPTSTDRGGKECVGAQACSPRTCTHQPGTVPGVDKAGACTCTHPPEQVRAPAEHGNFRQEGEREREWDQDLSLSQDAREPAAEPTEAPSDDARAGAFVRWYAEDAYPRVLRRPYVLNPQRDFQNAVRLVAAYRDDERLRRMAEFYLGCDHRDAQRGSRTIGQFGALAGWCDEQIAATEPTARAGPLGVLPDLWQRFQEAFAAATNNRIMHENLRGCAFTSDRGQDDQVVLLAPSEEQIRFVQRNWPDALARAASAIGRQVVWQPADEVTV